MQLKNLISVIACSLMLQGVFMVTAQAEPDYAKLSAAIRRVENGPTLNDGELYGIHSVHYKDALEARQICQRTARHAWERYHALNGLKSTKEGYVVALSKTYCPVNHDNWARMVNFYYKETT